jgi:F-type H+-transporting ATPase subunit gamma
MAGGQERILRRRIRSIQSTKKITRAMELIAASRIVRAQQAIAATRPYVEKMAEVVSHLSQTPDARTHPLFRTPDEVRQAVVIAIAGDRGLSGGYNSSILRATEKRIRDHEAAGHHVRVVAVGRKVGNYFAFRNQEIAEFFTGMADRPSVDDARRVVAAVMEPFATGDIDEIDIVYTGFESIARQRVESRALVPITPHDGADPAPSVAGRPEGFLVDYEYEPDPGELLDRLLPSWLQGEILAALLSASASEYVARQRAMKAATDNADELMKTLTQTMNRARQEAITTEITEIVGGSEALRAGASQANFNDTYEGPGAA